MKKKVLLFADYYLPGFRAGGPIRAIKALVAELSHDIDFTIVTRHHDFLDPTPYAQPTYTPVQVGPATVYYLPKMNFIFLSKLIKKEKFDIVYFNSFFSFSYSLLPLMFVRIFFNKLKIILAPRGEFSPGALEIKSKKKSACIRSIKQLSYYRKIKFHATSQLEVEHIHAVMGDVMVELASDFPSVDLVESNTIKQSNQLKMIYLSRVTRKKNLSYALNVLKSFLTEMITFDIYGPLEDANYWQECQNIIKMLPSNIQVSYKGLVKPDEVTFLFSQYDLFFFPTRGENFGYVIVEALSAGCPVLTSDQVPWQLEPNKAGWTIPLANENEYARIIREVYEMDSDVWAKIRENCRHYFTQTSQAPGLKALYLKMFN